MQSYALFFCRLNKNSHGICFLSSPPLPSSFLLLLILFFPEKMSDNWGWLKITSEVAYCHLSFILAIHPVGKPGCVPFPPELRHKDNPHRLPPEWRLHLQHMFITSWKHSYHNWGTWQDSQIEHFGCAAIISPFCGKIRRKKRICNVILWEDSQFLVRTCQNSCTNGKCTDVWHRTGPGSRCSTRVSTLYSRCFSTIWNTL